MSDEKTKDISITPAPPKESVISISGGADSVISVTQFAGRSAEYRELTERLEELKELFNHLPESDVEQRLKYSARINDVNSQIKAFEEEVVKLSETFNKIEDTTDRLDKAKKFFEQGDITGARNVLEGHTAERQHATQVLLAKKKDYEENVVPALKNVAAEYLILAQTAASAFDGPSQFDVANAYFKASVDTDASVDNLYAFAVFLQNHALLDEAEIYYRRLLDEFSDQFSPADLTGIYNSLGLLYSDRHDYKESEKEYMEALTILRDIATKDPVIYNPQLASVLNNLGSLHWILKMPKEAEAEYSESLELYRATTASESSPNYQADVANALNNLANLHADQNSFETSEKEYTEALKIYKELSVTNPRAFEPNMARTLDNLGVLKRSVKKYDEAAGFLEQALEIRKRLAAQNPRAFERDVAWTLNGLGAVHAETDVERAKIEYQQSLEIRRRLTAEDPEMHEADLATTLNNIANIDLEQKEFDMARKNYSEALGIFRRLAAEYPQVYASELSMVLGNLAELYQKQTEPDQKTSVALALEAMDIIFPFLAKVPILMEYATQASNVLKAWGFTDEEILKKVTGNAPAETSEAKEEIKAEAASGADETETPAVSNT